MKIYNLVLHFLKMPAFQIIKKKKMKKNSKSKNSFFSFPIHVANPCAQKREDVKRESPKWHNHFLSVNFNFDRLFPSETEFFVFPHCGTDLGSLIGNTQCENIRIFLPFKFIREINYGHFEAPKIAILTIWAALNFEFLGTFVISSVKFSKNQIQSLQNC